MNLSSPAAVSALLRRHHFLPAHRLGQNFLVDANILAKIAVAGELDQGDAVIEVGTGLGVLTRALAERVGPRGSVVTVERDTRLSPILADTLPVADYPQVRRVSADILDIDLPSTISELAAAGRRVSVVANIPYGITSPLLAKLLDCEARLGVIVLLVQKEVADRLAAMPGTSDYGAFTLFVQYHASVEMIAPVPASVFYPAPKVASAIVRLRPRETPAVEVGDRRLFFSIVHAAFQQRRKTLRNALSSDLLGWDKVSARSILDECGIDAGRRGETLSIDEFASIARAAAAQPRPGK